MGQLFKFIKELLTYQEKTSYSEFDLKEPSKKTSGENKENSNNLWQRVKQNIPYLSNEKKPIEETDLKKMPIKSDLEYNKKEIEYLYHLPENLDIVVREFNVGTVPPVPAFAVMIDGLVDSQLISDLLQALMLFSNGNEPKKKVTEEILKNFFPGQQTKLIDNFGDVLDSVNYGDTVFFFKDSKKALTVDTKGFKHRSIEKPSNEQLVMGPHESFNEVLRVNTGLIRRILRTKDLMTEYLKVGERVPNDVVVVYIKNLSNQALVEEVKRRISSLKVDYMLTTGMLEDLIEDRPYNIMPQTISTERPDKVASYLMEGKVGIIVGGSPNILIVPANIFDQLHTGEETYLKWQYGTFIRFVRMFAFFLALLLPGIYTSIMLYHQEMVPTELLMTIAGNREKVPFPTIVEILLMEVSFELLREAGIRVPGIIGPTIGIIGGLILGQASVEANLVSPILVILVSVTGLASFAIPNYSLSFALRISRFVYIFLGWFLGFFGIAVGLFIYLIVISNLKSFGVPYLAPVAPVTKKSRDIIIRYPLFLNKNRPDYLNTKDTKKSSSIIRGWMHKKKKMKGDRENGKS